MSEVKAPPNLRAQHLKEKVHMRDVMDHFGHRYRVNGNMFCCWHVEKNPSARLYDDQDTYWCWVCSPDHGVDIVEFVAIELGFAEELPGSVKAAKRHGYATLRALDYLEEEFGTSFEGQDWHNRAMAGLAALRPRGTHSILLGIGTSVTIKSSEPSLIHITLRDGRSMIDICPYFAPFRRMNS